MPSQSAKQHRLMEAVAHGWHPKHPTHDLPSAAVGKEFVAADESAGKYQGKAPDTKTSRP